MGRRYYCDYCDKQFIDDIEARKKHLNSAYHINQKKFHYDSFKDFSLFLQEETMKIPCRRFQSSYCQFENNCKYSHYTQEELWNIKQMILYEQQEKLRKEYENNNVQVPSPDEWLSKYMEKRDKENENVGRVFWTYPQQLENRFDLPPSLKKFQPEYFQSSDFPEWGK